MLAGAALLLWPAFLNGYPILFSDTGAFLAQTVVPLMIWDKPWIYGPFAWLFHQHVSLWGVVAAQALIVSHLVWLLARVLADPAMSGAYTVSDIILDHHDLLAGVAALTGAHAQTPARSDASLLRVPRCDRLAALGWSPRGWERLHADLPAIIEECP